LIKRNLSEKDVGIASNAALPLETGDGKQNLHPSHAMWYAKTLGADTYGLALVEHRHGFTIELRLLHAGQTEKKIYVRADIQKTTGNWRKHKQSEQSEHCEGNPKQSVGKRSRNHGQTGGLLACALTCRP
jgi:hypothetical protein